MMMEYGMCCCRMSYRRAWNAYGVKELRAPSRDQKVSE